jgi:hypothetical protein
MWIIEELKKLREIAERDPGLLEVIEEAKAARCLVGERPDQPQRRLRMPYVSSEPLTEGSWK